MYWTMHPEKTRLRPTGPLCGDGTDIISYPLLPDRPKIDEAMRWPEVRSAGRAASIRQSVQNGQFPQPTTCKRPKIRTTSLSRAILAS
jgi:hypothetical protein